MAYHLLCLGIHARAFASFTVLATAFAANSRTPAPRAFNLLLLLFYYLGLFQFTYYSHLERSPVTPSPLTQRVGSKAIHSIRTTYTPSRFSFCAENSGSHAYE